MADLVNALRRLAEESAESPDVRNAAKKAIVALTGDAPASLKPTETADLVTALQAKDAEAASDLQKALGPATPPAVETGTTEGAEAPRPELAEVLKSSAPAAPASTAPAVTPPPAGGLADAMAPDAAPASRSFDQSLETGVEDTSKLPDVPGAGTAAAVAGTAGAGAIAAGAASGAPGEAATEAEPKPDAGGSTPPATMAATEDEPDEETTATKEDDVLSSMNAVLASMDDGSDARPAVRQVQAALVDPERGPRAMAEVIKWMPEAPTEVSLSPQERRAYENDKSELLRSAMDARERIDWSEVAETVGNALIRMAAAAYGLKKGVDLSNVQTVKADWERKRDRIMDDYKTALDIKMRAHSERLADLRENKRTAENLSAERRGYVAAGERMKVEDATFNARQTQGASETNARLAADADNAGVRMAAVKKQFLVGEIGKNYRAKLAAEARAAKEAATKTDKADVQAQKAADAKVKATESRLAAYDAGYGEFEAFLSETDSKKKDEHLAKVYASMGKAGISSDKIQKVLDEADEAHFFDSDKGEAAKKGIQGLRDSVPRSKLLFELPDGKQFTVDATEEDIAAALERFPEAKPVRGGLGGGKK